MLLRAAPCGPPPRRAAREARVGHTPQCRGREGMQSGVLLMVSWMSGICWSCSTNGDQRRQVQRPRGVTMRQNSETNRSMRLIS